MAEAVKLASKAVELNEASARQISSSRTTILMAVGMAILVVILALSFAITLSILGPVRELTAVSRKIAVGDLDATVVYQARDEFGVLANSFRDLSSFIRAVSDATGALAKGDLTVRIQPKSEQDVLSSSFNGAASSLAKIIQNVAGVADALNGAAGKVSLASGSVQTQNQETNSQVTAVSAAVSRIGAHVETAAAGAEEMSATVTEITRNSQHAKEIADSALNLVTSASHTIGTLSESSAAIGKMVKIISGIAGQTQMLALNATMESARAGEQGKGFAVVASEVKELAKGTAKATAEISAQIAAIQRDSEGAVLSIQKISEVMHDINDTQGSILASLEEQSAAALEMSTTLSEMAHNATEIGESVSHVTDAVIQTTEGVATTFAAADELTTMSASLRSLVGVFKAGDKVAA